MELTWRGHGDDVVVQILRFSISPLVGGQHSHPVHGHGLQTHDAVGAHNDGARVTATPFRVLRWPELHKVPLGLVLNPFLLPGLGPGQGQGGVGGVCHLQVDDATRWLWRVEAVLVRT